MEKLTGERGRASNNAESVTSTTECFVVPDGRLMIADTPGSNAMANTFQQNVWIAQAISYRPVSKILVTVPAHTRIDNVVGTVTEYADRFLDMDDSLMGVIVTHMDTVEWPQERCLRHLQQRGISDVIFTNIGLQGADIENRILQMCTATQDITVNHANFLKLFKIGDYQKRVVRATKKKVDDFNGLYNAFMAERAKYPAKEAVDLLFEFVAWMESRIYEAKKEVSTELGFTFEDNVANEVGYIASMTNQMSAILMRIRTEVIGIQAAHGVNDLRKCPYCGLVWGKFEGCDGETTCGNRPSRSFDARYAELATFTFSWDGTTLAIRRSGQKNVRQGRRQDRGVGCGRSINWKTMNQAPIPAEFSVIAEANVKDVEVMPRVPASAEARFKAAHDNTARASAIRVKRC